MQSKFLFWKTYELSFVRLYGRIFITFKNKYMQLESAYEILPLLIKLYTKSLSRYNILTTVVHYDT